MIVVKRVASEVGRREGVRGGGGWSGLVALLVLLLLLDMFRRVPTVKRVDEVGPDTSLSMERVIIEHVWGLWVLVGRSTVDVRVDREGVVVGR